MTYFQRLLAAPRTAAEACYDSFPLRAQESIFFAATLLFQFSHSHFSFFYSFLQRCHSSSLNWAFFSAGFEKESGGKHYFFE